MCHTVGRLGRVVTAGLSWRGRRLVVGRVPFGAVTLSTRNISTLKLKVGGGRFPFSDLAVCLFLDLESSGRGERGRDVWSGGGKVCMIAFLAARNICITCNTYAIMRLHRWKTFNTHPLLNHWYHFVRSAQL